MTVISVALILISADVVAPLPKLAPSEDFMLQNEISTGLHRYFASYVSKKTRSVLEFDYSGDGSLYGKIRLDALASPQQYQTQMPDGYPLGEDARIVRSPGQYFVQAIVGGVQMRLHARGVVERTNGRPTFAELTENDGSPGAWIAILRQFSARVAGKRGKASESFVAAGSGIEYEKLTTFAGLDGKWPNASRVVTKVNGKELVFVLGANGVQKNGVWQNLGDSPMVIGTDLYVPKAALN